MEKIKSLCKEWVTPEISRALLLLSQDAARLAAPVFKGLPADRACCSSKCYRVHPRGETAPQKEGTKAASPFLYVSRAVLCRQTTLYTVTTNVNSQIGERSGIGAAGQRSKRENDASKITSKMRSRIKSGANSSFTGLYTSWS